MPKDNEHPFFRPLWRRILVVAICAGWAAIEWIGNQPTWGVIATAFTAYAAWAFLISYKPPAVSPDKPET